MNICIIGTGYVGLVSAACFAETGNHVVCVDKNPKIIEGLNEGRIHIYEPGLEPLVKRSIEEGRLKFTADIEKGLKDALFVFNCVGTPSKENGDCNLSYVFQVAEQIGKVIEDYKVIINKSTVPVGTADRVRKIISNELEKRNKSVEFDVVSNPEFLKEGDAISDFMKPDRIIVGTDNVRTAKLLETLYAPFARSRDKMLVMSIRSAEITKYAANCMLATKISFINEMANICERVGADIGEVRLGIGADHRIGHSFIYPGVGYGGSCFPKDVKALINTAREYTYDPQLISAVDQVNMVQKALLAKKVVEHYSAGGDPVGRTMALWGLAFKANTDDMREAPSLSIIEILTDAGMHIRAFDPVANRNAEKLLFANSRVEIFNNQYEPLKDADGLVVVTDWNQFRNPDFQRIRQSLKTPVIFDGRNLYSSERMRELGFNHISIGRQPVFQNNEHNESI